MSKRFLFLTILLITALALISYKITHAFFSDAASSTNNIFAASTLFPTPTVNAGDVVINEINWVGSNGSGLDEWIELRNMTSNTISLNNWVVENLGLGGPNANMTIASSSASIPPNGFFLISAFPKSGSKINVDPDYINSAISLDNGGEQLKLKTNLGVLIDTANATSGAWFTGSNSTPKKSMERKDPPGDGTISTNWQDATTHTNMDGSGSTDEFGTPKSANGL